MNSFFGSLKNSEQNDMLYAYDAKNLNSKLIAISKQKTDDRKVCYYQLRLYFPAHDNHFQYGHEVW